MITSLELTLILFEITFSMCIMIINGGVHLFFYELHSQIATLVSNVFTFVSPFKPFILALGLNTFPTAKPRLMRQHFIIWRVTFGYFTNLVVDFGVCGWCIMVTIRKLSCVVSIKSKKERKKSKKDEKNEKVSIERSEKNVEKKSQKFEKRDMSKNVWRGCIIMTTYFQWSI